MNANNPSREHHYVPCFLLRPWADGGELSGFFWDPFVNGVKVRKKGVSAFCKQRDLFTLAGEGAATDALEREFFVPVDDLGAKAAVKLQKCRPDDLSLEERTDFVRLLLSLDARRPSSVKKLVNEYPVAIAKALNESAEIAEAFLNAGCQEEPLLYWERNTGFSREDQALLALQRLVDNPAVGQRLLNANWHVVGLTKGDGSLLFSDRPLVRVFGFDNPNALWALPLSPRLLFLASNSMSTIANIKQRDQRDLRKKMNVSSVNQRDKYVFASDNSNLPLIEKMLRSASVGKA